MTTESKSANDSANNQQVYSALVALSEPELLRLFNRVKALRHEMHRIILSNPEPISVVTSTQDLLKIWRDELDRLLVAKQAQATSTQLGDWNNEGGAVKPVPKQRASSDKASEKSRRQDS